MGTTSFPVLRTLFLFLLVLQKVTFTFEMFCSGCGTACPSEANFCHRCGVSFPDGVLVDLNYHCSRCGILMPGRPREDERCEKCVEDMSTNAVIEKYFHRGYQYNNIVDLLKTQGKSMTLRTLKRKLQDLGLSRRGAKMNEQTLRSLIEEEIQGAGRLAGYRSIWHALRLRHKMHVPRQVVARLLKEIDPDGVEDRRSRRITRRKYTSLGPNFCWHIDGNYHHNNNHNYSCSCS